MKKIFILPDQHYPLHDPQAISIVEQAIKMVKPDEFVNLGDVGEWESVSAWQWKKRKRPPLEYQTPMVEADIDAVVAGIGNIDDHLKRVGCSKKYMLEGNHDAWLDSFGEENPFLGYSFKDSCEIEKRGYKYYPYGTYLKLGKVNLYHGGHFTTKYHAAQHVTQLGANVIYGHVHDFQSFFQPGAEETHGAWSMGTVKKIDHANNLWLKGRRHNWVLGFGILYLHRSGNFRVEQVTITNGRTYLWGKELIG